MKITTLSFFAAAIICGFVPVNAREEMSFFVPKSKSNWEVNAGFGIRQSFDINVSSSSRDLFGGLFSQSDADAALFASIGPDNAEANRLYDDGFVNIGSAFNLTTDWGYDDASQVRQSSQAWDPVDDQSLYLSRSGQTGIAGFNSSKDSGEELFPYIEARRWSDCDKDSFWSKKGIVVSWSWIPSDVGITENLLIQRTTVVDEFFLYGIIPPPAPYTGPPLPPGPILDNLPHDREETNDTNNLVGSTESNVDLDLQTVSFGGAWRYVPKSNNDIFDRINLYGLDLQAGGSINLARLKMDSMTTVTESNVVIGSFDDHASEFKILPGIYVSLGATFDIGQEENWMFFTQVRYDYVGDIKASNGPSSTTVDLQGYSVSFGIGKSW